VIARAVFTFELNLITGVGVVMIARLKHGANYKKELKSLAKVLKPLVDLEGFASIPLVDAIDVLSADPEISTREHQVVDEMGGKTGFTSPSRKEHVFKDTKKQKALKALGNVKGQLGNYYAPQDEVLKKPMHFKVYGRDNRLGLFGQRTEEEVRHVLRIVQDALK
jgi:hypothetical protein